MIVTVTDDDGGVGFDTVVVIVNNVVPEITSISAPVDPVQVDTEINISADFTDPGVLDLGHKPAGFYATREKSAYWDGRNESGESVSSGIYFYQIQAGEFATTRKMTILK